MTFEEILPKLKKGHECRRRGDIPIHIKDKTFYRRIAWQAYERPTLWYAYHDDLLADDWEVGRMVPTKPHAYLAYLQQDITNWG